MAVFSARLDQLGEIHDLIDRLGAVTALDDPADLFRCRLHHGRIGSREINLFDVWSVSEISADRVRDQHGVVNHFSLSEGVHALPEGAYDREGQAAELDDFADGLFLRPVELLGHFLGDHSDFVVLLRVLGVKEPAGDHHQIAHDSVVRENAEHGDVALLASAHGNAFTQRDHGRSGNDAGHFLHGGIHVVNGQRVGGDIGDALAAALVFGLDLVGADGLDLAQHVLLAGHADGYNEDQGGGADDHPQRGQSEAYLVAAESLVGETQDLAVHHFRRTSFRRGGGGSRHAYSD